MQLTWFTGRPTRGLAVAGALVALALLPGALRAQQQLTGRVLDSRDRAPLAGASVSLSGTGVEGTTDAEGRFALALPADARFQLRVRRIGYLPWTREYARGALASDVEVLLESAATELAPIVVTATRDPRSLADVPAAIAVADSTVLNQGRTAGLHEVLRYQPGVQANSRYGLDDVNISIRGAGVRSTFGVRGVAVVLDGVPITEPDGQTRLDIIELAAARQVEVLRGPASALYGGAASGGAVNIISKTGAEAPGVMLRARGGSFGFQKYEGSYGTGLAGDRGALYASGTWTDSEGFRAHNEDRIWRLNLRSDYAVTDRTGVSLEGSTSNLDMQIPGNLTEAEFDANPDAADPRTVASDYGRIDTRWRAGTRVQHRFGGDVPASGYLFLGGRTLDHPIFQVIVQDLSRVQAGGKVRLPLLGQAGSTLTVTAGGDYDRTGGQDQRFVNVAGERGDQVADADVRLPSLGLYAQAESRITPRLSLIAGLRWDNIEYGADDRIDPARSFEKTFSEVSPKGTLAYRTGDNSSVYASVAQGFEPPTNAELTASPDPDEAINSSLEPQYLTNYEVGFKTMVQDRVFLDLALFRTDITGEFIQSSVIVPGGPPRTVYQNAGESRHVGLEAGVRALVTDWLDVVASYTWSDFVLEEFTAGVTNPDGSATPIDFAGNRLPGVPVHRLAGELRFRPAPAVSAFVGAEWQGQVYVDNANAEDGIVYARNFGGPVPTTPVPYRAIDPYGIVNVGGAWTVGLMTLQVSVENLFNTTYVGNASINAADGRFYSAGAGRYLSVGASVNMLGGSR